jgi:hypothetical protein
MAQDFEKRGIEFVDKGTDRFIAALDRVNASVERMSANIERQMEKAAEKSSQSVDRISKNAEKLEKSFSGKLTSQVAEFGKSLSNIPGIAGKVGAALSSLPVLLTSLSNPITAVIAAVGAVISVLATFGPRGAAFVGIQQSFQNLSSQAGLVADSFLNRLSTAAAHTISELELMRQTNVALAGSTGSFRTEFAEALPRLLEIARVQARATGQSVEFLFQSLVTGIKRGSPMLIDNTGLVLKAGEAMDAYARSVGKTVEQLTAAERQTAILNATLEAGAIAIDAAGGVQEGAAEKFARIQARITNIMDRFGVILQPLWQLILDGVDGLLAKVEELVIQFGPQLQSLLVNIADFARLWGGIWQGILTPVFQVFGWIFGIIQNVGAKFMLGAARWMGSLANGIIQGYNTYVFPVVLRVATMIADFLVGQSPPPLGPLSKIDDGGANTMQAWIDGFAGVSMQPVEQAAAFVSDAMGSVATASLATVEKRLHQLDRAIQPFVNQLEIAKARFEAIQEPAEAALRAIDRQLDKAVEALNRGDAGSDALVRNLDARREALLGYIDAQQASADQAQFQLLLAKAQQAEERAILGIRKKQFSGSQQQGPKNAKGVSSSASGAAPKEKKGTGEGASAVGEVAVDTAITPPKDDGKVIPSFFDQLGTAFSDQLDPANLKALDLNQELLGKQFGRLEDANFAERFGNMFGDLGTTLETNFVQPIREKIDDVINFFTGTDEGTLNWALSNPENVMSLAGQLLALPAAITENWLFGLPQALIDALETPFDNTRANIISTLTGEQPESLKGRLTHFFTGSGDGTLNGMLNVAVGFFASLPSRIGTALSSVGMTLWNAIAVPLQNALNSAIDMANQFIDENADFANQLAALLLIQGVDFHQLQIGHVEFAPPAWLNSSSGGRGGTGGRPNATGIGGAAKGGIFSSGILEVGERGREYIVNAADKMAVFPNGFVRAAESLNRTFSAVSAARPVYDTGTVNNSYSNSNMQTNNISYVRDNQDLMQRMALLKAYGKGRRQ